MALKIVLIGYGGIASGTAAGIDQVPDVKLVGVVVRTAGRAADDGLAEISFQQGLETADLFVECAGVDAVRSYGPRIITEGKNLLLTSVGALAEPELRADLIEGGPGKLFLTNGAIGGLDILSGAALTGGLDKVSLETRKTPTSLVQPWMSEEQQAELKSTSTPLTVFEGNVSDAIEKFPENLNVAVALAYTTEMWEETVVRLIADPDAEQTKHVITAAGSAGSYQFQINNRPLPDSPATSGIVIGSVLSGIRTIAGASGINV